MTSINQVDFEKIIADPSACYELPEEILHDSRLSRKQKIAILKLWAFDARELQVAEEENMRGDSGATMLTQVLEALRQIE